MHTNNTLVANELRARGIEPRIRIIDAHATTAAHAAEVLECEVGAIANSLIFLCDHAPLLVMTSGAHRVDTEALAARIGAQSITRASAAMVKEATGQAIGGVSPTGHPAPIRCYVDVTLSEYPTLWAAAGTANSLMPLTYPELLRVSGGTPISVTA